MIDSRLEAQTRLQAAAMNEEPQRSTSSSSTNPRSREQILNGHPIFDPSSGGSGDNILWKADDPSLELSISSLAKFKSSDAVQDTGVPNGRRRTMLIKDADLIVAVEKQVRMTSLTESQPSTPGEQTFKVRWTTAWINTRHLYPARCLRRCARRICNSKSTNSC